VCGWNGKGGGVVGLVEAVGGATVYVGVGMIRSYATSESAETLRKVLWTFLNNVLVVCMLGRVFLSLSLYRLLVSTEVMG
jgi:hypothetical protein